MTNIGKLNIIDFIRTTLAKSMENARLMLVFEMPGKE